jgi:hypothetical protein
VTFDPQNSDRQSPAGLPHQREAALAGFHELFVYWRFAARLLDVWKSRDADIATVRYRVEAELIDQLALQQREHCDLRN